MIVYVAIRKNRDGELPDITTVQYSAQAAQDVADADDRDHRSIAAIRPVIRIAPATLTLDDATTLFDLAEHAPPQKKGYGVP